MIRLLLPLLALPMLASLPWAANTVLGQEPDSDSAAPADVPQPEGAESSPESAADDDSTDVIPESGPETEGEAEAEELPAEDPETAPTTEPEGVRRKRPRTEAEEREYKLRKTREDPYLNAPVFKPAADGATQFYNPSDWIRTAVTADSSRYLIQDEQGQPAGTLVLETSVENDVVMGPVVRLSKLRKGADSERIEVWLDSTTLKPRRVVSLTAATEGQLYDRKGRPMQAPAAATAEDGSVVVETTPRQMRTTVDYRFDRVTIVREVSEEGVTQGEKMRQLLFSFDREQLPLLVRQLDFRRADWPFEAIVIVPQTRQNLQLQIGIPERVDQLSAEPQKYGCFKLTMRLGSETLTWWVERQAPHRLVRFTDGNLTYTLQGYDAGAIK
jgi:hypothetical protein